MTKDYAVNAHLCPLCGKDNRCAMQEPATGSTSTACAEKTQASNCWCMSENVPRGLCQSVPEAAQAKACICQACVQAYKAEQLGG